MKIENYIWLCLMVVFTLLLAGCSKDDVAEEEVENPTFVMYIYLPEQVAVTRADDVLVNATAEENTIHKLQIWVFGWGPKESAPDELELKSIPEEDGAYNSTCGCLYKELDDVSLTEGLKEVIFGVKEDFKDKYPKLDVYVIGNAPSIATGIGLDSNTPRARLRDLKITGADYGVTAHNDGNKYPTASAVGNNGLPMSACVEGADVSPSGTMFSINQLTLERAVSKIRFVFSRSEAETSGIVSATVSAINLDGFYLYGGQNNAELHQDEAFLPEYEYLFRDLRHDAEDRVTDMSNTYSISRVDFPTPEAIPEYINPWALRWDHEESRQDWEDKINLAIIDNKVSVCGPYYLRETDHYITGTISYTFVKLDKDGTPKTYEHTARFTVNTENGFLRNHTWTIYAYFSEGGAVFEVDNWDPQVVDFKPFV